MKKIIKVLSNIILIISILLVVAIAVFNLIIIIRVMFLGITVGGEYPDTIWFSKQTLYGISGIQKFYLVWGKAILMIGIPVVIFCVMYQFLYFRILRKKL